VIRPGSGEVVTLQVWRVPLGRLPRALWRMARDRRRLRRTPGVRFAKLLGTAAGFGPARADPTRWAALTVWVDPVAAAGVEDSPVARSWRALATAYCRLDLQTVTSRGEWAGREPFTPPGPDRAGAEGPVLALTRSRLRPSRAWAFWRAIGPVATAARVAPGLLAAFGIGEAPLGWQGTVSVWRRPRDLVEFAYRDPRHASVIERTPGQGWYEEELFARFTVTATAGNLDVIGWTGQERATR
jgi:hypothetical protein